MALAVEVGGFEQALVALGAVELRPRDDRVALPVEAGPGSSEHVARLKTKTWTYRYVRVEVGPEGPEAIFQLSEPEADAQT